MLASARPASAQRAWSVMLVAAFSAAVFTSAALLFVVQPMIGKMVLPLLGGTPAVWNTCMVFFQAALLGGYVYSHASGALTLRRQLLVHAALLAAALLALPVAFAPTALQLGGSNPVFRLIALLVASVGLPFFVVSATAPLLQRWFANTHHPAAHDPYFLYGASNIGSIAALVAYPVVIEPQLRLVEQSTAWTAGYVLLTALILGCGLLMLMFANAAAATQLGAAPDEGLSLAAGAAAPSSPRRLRWIALAFVPSSWMLGVTSYVTSDIAAIPLLWVIPLLLYLLTFVLAFSRARPLLYETMSHLAPPALLLLVFVMISRMPAPAGALWSMVVLHFLVFFVVAVVCHGELAGTRPAARYLTEFYLWISLGGVLGGIFNALLAPALFKSVAEYPLALVFACLLFVPAADRAPGWRKHLVDVAWALAVTAVAAILVLHDPLVRQFVGQVCALAGIQPAQLNAFSQRWLRLDIDVLLQFAIPVALCFALIPRPRRFAYAVAGVLLAAALFTQTGRQVLYAQRTFFGVLHVEQDADARWLIHGTTVHGMQRADPARRAEPMTYFHRAGPIGQVFEALNATAALQRIGIIGLGTGSLAAYARPGQNMTFYEIDPAVSRVASEYFTFLSDAAARGAHVDTVLGDARLKIADTAADHAYSLFVVDAFSSDAIPVHLITQQAIQLYLTKLAPRGVMAFHISNRYIDLEPVLANIAQATQLVGLIQRDTGDLNSGRTPSHWVVLARRSEDLGRLLQDARWQLLRPRSEVGVWSDDSTNLLQVFRWKR